MAPGQTDIIVSSKSRYQFMTMKIKLVLAIALQLAVFALADKETDSLNQMEMKLTRTMDELNKKDIIKIYGDMITLEKVDVEEDAEVSRTISDPLVGEIEQFLRTRRIQIHFPKDGSSADFLGRALGEKDIGVELRGLVTGASEARTKLKKIVLPLLLALKLKKLIVLPIIIGLIALISIKGLSAGALALLFSGAVALKSILTPPPPPARVSYGVVKPHDVHEHWHRSQEEVNQPYRGWAPEYNPEYNPYQEIP